MNRILAISDDSQINHIPTRQLEFSRSSFSSKEEASFAASQEQQKKEPTTRRVVARCVSVAAKFLVFKLQSSTSYDDFSRLVVCLRTELRRNLFGPCLIISSGDGIKRTLDRMTKEVLIHRLKSKALPFFD